MRVEGYVWVERDGTEVEQRRWLKCTLSHHPWAPSAHHFGRYDRDSIKRHDDYRDWPTR